MDLENATSKGKPDVSMKEKTDRSTKADATGVEATEAKTIEAKATAANHSQGRQRLKISFSNEPMCVLPPNRTEGKSNN
jgi:hypothetical protein